VFALGGCVKRKIEGERQFDLIVCEEQLSVRQADPPGAFKESSNVECFRVRLSGYPFEYPDSADSG